MKKTIAIIMILLMSMTMSGCWRVIEDGEVGVQKTLGDYDDQEIGTGLDFYVPVISFIHVVNTKKTTIDEAVQVPTSDGLVVGLDVSVIYKVKSERASEIKQTVTGNIKDTLLVPYIRSGLRNTVSAYTAEAIYEETGRELVEEELFTLLQEKVGENLEIVDVLLRDVLLPDAIKQAIDAQLQAEYKIKEKLNLKEQTIIDAQIRVEEANGIAEANKIISNSITGEYLQYEFIKGLADSGADVIYVPTEANIPIMEASRFQQTTQG